MGLIDILTGPVTGLVGAIGGVIDSLHTSDDEKAAANLQIAALAADTELKMTQELTKELEAKERVIVAELQQGDNYTKRARPTVVYVGLGAFILNYVLIPNIAFAFGTTLVPVEFPVEFWAGWSGIVMTWTIGRSMEKRAVTQNGPDGSTSRLVKIITG